MSTSFFFVLDNSYMYNYSLGCAHSKEKKMLSHSPRVSKADASHNSQLTRIKKRYVPATLRRCDSEGWFVEYYAFNPYANQLQRRRIYVNRYRKRYRRIYEFQLFMDEYIAELNADLAAGWSPFKKTRKQTTNRACTPMVDVVNAYEKEKRNELRDDTMRSYSCYCAHFREYITEVMPDLRCSDYTREMAVEYMDYLGQGERKSKSTQKSKNEDGSLSARTYNNNLKFCRGLFSWAVSKCYCQYNPFEAIKTKREPAKLRTVIPPEDRQRIKRYFAENNPAFLIVMELVYTSLLRPAEISRIRVGQINFEQHCIEMNLTQTKNGKARNGRMNATLEAMLKEHIQGAMPSEFLFSGKTWKPGMTSIVSHTYSCAWIRMRNALKLPEEYQLYSLRDSGIYYTLKAGADDLSVMQAAGHSDLSMTTRYANHVDVDLIERLNAIAPKL